MEEIIKINPKQNEFGCIIISETTWNIPQSPQICLIADVIYDRNLSSRLLKICKINKLIKKQYISLSELEFRDNNVQSYRRNGKLIFTSTDESAIFPQTQLENILLNFANTFQSMFTTNEQLKKSLPEYFQPLQKYLNKIQK